MAAIAQLNVSNCPEPSLIIQATRSFNLRRKGINHMEGFRLRIEGMRLGDGIKD